MKVRAEEEVHLNSYALTWGKWLNSFDKKDACPLSKGMLKQVTSFQMALIDVYLRGRIVGCLSNDFIDMPWPSKMKADMTLSWFNGAMVSHGSSVYLSLCQVDIEHISPQGLGINLNPQLRIGKVNWLVKWVLQKLRTRAWFLLLLFKPGMEMPVCNSALEKLRQEKSLKITD